MHNSNSRSLRLATPLGVPLKSEAALPTRIPISPLSTVPSSSKPGLEGSSPGAEGWWRQAQPEEDPEQERWPPADPRPSPRCW